jgi:hypothetical protein
MGFILLIMKGYSSSYQIWNYISKNPNSKIKSMAYNNVNKRILLLHKKGYLEEVKAEQYSLHGRKDYRIKRQVIELLISYLLFQSENFEIISEYISRSKLNRKAFEDRLSLKLTDILEAGNSYYDSVGMTVTLPSKRIGNIRIDDVKEPKLEPLKAQQPKRKLN